MNMKFERLVISQEVLSRYMRMVENPGKNLAFTHDDFPGTVFMQYSEKGETFFTMVSAEDYQKIRGEFWSGTNKYVTTYRNGKTIYLHRELCPGLQKGQFAHHRGSKFDNRPQMLEAVTPAEHDQHRTYCGDLVIDVK